MELFGERIKLARLRRNFPQALVASRAGITPKTLIEIEKGNPKVQIGLYLNVLFVLGLHEDINQVAENDELGRKLQDIGMLPKQRALRNKTRLKDENK